MSSGQIHKEIFAKKIEEQIKYIEECEETLYWLDTPWIKQILRDSIKFYYKDENR
jgi:hypothetical protein